MRGQVCCPSRVTPSFSLWPRNLLDLDREGVGVHLVSDSSLFEDGRGVAARSGQESSQALSTLWLNALATHPGKRETC
jgi:hypothetical protein